MLGNVKRKNLIDRLILNEKRIESIRSSINEIKKFKSPVGKTLASWRRPNGLRIKKSYNVNRCYRSYI